MCEKKIIFKLVGNLPKESWKTQRAETDGPGHAEDCMALERELSLIYIMVNSTPAIACHSLVFVYNHVYTIKP